MTVARGAAPAPQPAVDTLGLPVPAGADAVLVGLNQPRARGLVLLKMGLVLVGLGLLLVWVGEGLPAQRPSLSAVALTVLLYQAALYAAALRLQATLAAFGITITARQSFAIHLRSLFYFFFVPMSVGYEITRFIAVRRIDPDASVKQVVIALLMDRVLGLLAALLALAALAAVVLPARVWSGIDLAWVMVAALVALVLGVAVMAHGPLRGRVRDLLGALRTGWPRLALAHAVFPGRTRAGVRLGLRLCRRRRDCGFLGTADLRLVGVVAGDGHSAIVVWRHLG